MNSDYDRMGREYAFQQQKNVIWSQDEAAIFLESTIAGSSGMILDAGCGTGGLMRLLKEKGHDIWGIDKSRQMVELAPRELNSRIFVESVEKTHFPADTFSAIISRYALHYLRDLEKTYSEFHRILKPGGVLALVVQHPVYDYELNKEYGTGIKTKLQLFDLLLEFPSHTLSDYISHGFLSRFALEKIEEGSEQGCLTTIPAYLGIMATKRR